jgi:hypothetical protein
VTPHRPSGPATLHGGGAAPLHGGGAAPLHGGGAAPLRGGAVGALTAALAVAGHGLAGGGLPTAAALTLLVLCSIGAGALAATAGGTRASLVAALGGGQLLGHLALSSAVAHQHAQGGASAAVMLAAHAAATVLCAALILAAEKLHGSITRVLRVVLRHAPALPRIRPGQPTPSAPDSLRHLLLDHVVSRRGPPARAFA